MAKLPNGISALVQYEHLHNSTQAIFYRFRPVSTLPWYRHLLSSIVLVPIPVPVSLPDTASVNEPLPCVFSLFLYNSRSSLSWRNCSRVSETWAAALPSPCIPATRLVRIFYVKKNDHFIQIIGTLQIVVKMYGHWLFFCHLKKLFK